MTNKQLPSAEIDISKIAIEVKKNGFYSAFCADLVNGAIEHHERILLINMIAKSAGLKVSFNVSESVCIFEALTD